MSNLTPPTPIHNDTVFGDFSIVVLSPYKYQVWYSKLLVGHCIYTLDKGWWFKCHKTNYNKLFRPLENVNKEREVANMDQLINRLNNKLWSNTWKSRLQGKFTSMLQELKMLPSIPQNAIYPTLQGPRYEQSTQNHS